MAQRVRPPSPGLTTEQVDLLLADLHPARVMKRSQGGATLSFLEAHDVRATLIRVFGFAQFDIETTRVEVMDVSRRNPDGTGNYVVTALAQARLTIHTTGAVYSDVAAATQVGNVLGDTMDFAVKTAASDAMKRCAANLGTQFGLSLYAQGATRDQVRFTVDPDQWHPRPERQPMSQEVQDMVARATMPNDGEPVVAEAIES
jgi:recombination DNA repair RAD52 pathway protein